MLNGTVWLLYELSSTLPLPTCKAYDRIIPILMYKYRNLYYNNYVTAGGVVTCISFPAITTLIPAIIQQ